MRPATLLLMLIMAASPAAAQSCATLGGGLDCGAAPTRPPTKSPEPSRPGRDADIHGHAEATVSSGGRSSATVDSTVIDSHGVVEFGFGAAQTRCRHAGYGTLCE